MKNLIATFIFILSGTSLSFSQDIIVLKTGDEIQAQIIKIGVEDIEFRQWNKRDETYTMVVEMDLIESYRFGDKKSEKVGYMSEVMELNSQENYDMTKSNIIKTAPWSLYFNTFRFGFEKSIDYKSSIEIQFMLRNEGLLTSASDDNWYYNFVARKKFYQRSKSVKMTDELKNPLSGVYGAPFITAGTSAPTNAFFYNESGNATPTNKKNVFVAGGFDIGIQEMIGNVAIDISTGMGYGYNTLNKDFARNYAYWSLQNNMVYRFAIKLGYNF